MKKIKINSEILDNSTLDAMSVNTKDNHTTDNVNMDITSIASDETYPTNTELNDSKILLDIKNVTSLELKKIDAEYIPYIDDISLSVKEGDILAISSDNITALRLFMEIIAQMRCIKTGEIITDGEKNLAPVGHFMSKILYFDNHRIMNRSFSVIEQLVFTNSKTKRTRTERIQLQKEWLSVLAELGLKQLALKSIKDLEHNEKLIITTLSAAMLDCKLIIANLAEYKFKHKQIEILNKVYNYLIKKGKTIIFSTMQPQVIGMTAKNLAYITCGKLLYSGTVSELYKRWDHVFCSIICDNSDNLISLFEKNLKNYTAFLQDGVVYVKYFGENEGDSREILRLLEENDIALSNIKFNDGRVANAIEELLKNDI